MRVKRVTFAGVADVYNMEVADVHDFAVASGVIVHNCYDDVRYMCQRNPIAPRKAIPQKAKQYNPLDDTPTQYGRYDFYNVKV